LLINLAEYFYCMVIPIRFEYQGKVYEGEFSQVSGSGSNSMLRLNIGGFHQGQLWYSEHWGWQWASNKDHFKGLAEYFGSYVTAWLDGQ